MSTRRKETRSCGVCGKAVTFTQTDFVGWVPAHTPHDCALHSATRAEAAEKRAAELQAQLDEARRENVRLDEKWQYYEREHVLPLFKRAKALEFDLQEMVFANPGKCSTTLFAEAVEKRAAEAERKAFEGWAHAGQVQMERDAANARAERLREEMLLMISYLVHEDQDANHEWMVKHMRAALAATAPKTAETEQPHPAASESMPSRPAEVPTEPGTSPAESDDAEMSARTWLYSQLGYIQANEPRDTEHSVQELAALLRARDVATWNAAIDAAALAFGANWLCLDHGGDEMANIRKRIRALRKPDPAKGGT